MNNNFNFPVTIANDQNNTLQQGIIQYSPNYNSNDSVQLTGHNLTRAENQAQRYWQLQQNLYAIYQNEHNRYNYLKSSQDNLLKSINFDMIRFWRYKKKFYYRPSQDSDLIIGSKDEITNEISSRYHNINVHIVDDLNDVLTSVQVKINTVYIALNSITVVENEVFETRYFYNIFLNQNGSFSRNLLHHTPYLLHRFFNYLINNDEISFTKLLLILFTQKDTHFIVDWLGSFFKTMKNNSQVLVLVENKDVSIDIFYKHIIIPIFGKDFCITITDELLSNSSIEDIVKYKLFYHIEHIPQDENNRKKLRDIINTILVKKVVSIDGQVVPVIGQILFTLDKPEMFLKEFLSSCKIFYVESINNLQSKLVEWEDCLERALRSDTLDYFSKELSAIGANIDLTGFYGDDSHSFKYTLEDIELKEQETINDNMLINTILDPFEDSFDSLIPLEERYQHSYITGKSDSGKSELLKTLIYRDILRADGSIILIEPHSDFSNEIVRLVPTKERLIFVDPTLDANYTPTINLFDLEDRTENNIAKMTQVISSIIKDINSEDKLTGTMVSMLENCISVLLREDGGDFFELNRFMNDKRNNDLVKRGKNSPNPLEREFFTDEFEDLKSTKDALKRRIKKLLSEPLFANLINGKDTVNLEKNMNTKGKVIIFKIPKDDMQNSYKYYGRFLTELIKIIALKRAKLPEESRVHTHLYIDEAHNFITSAISTILKETRKFKLFLTFSNQVISDIKETSLKEILLTSNVKIMGNNSNETLQAINKTLQEDIKDLHCLEKGEFYLKVGNNELIKINNTTRLLGYSAAISNEKWQEYEQYQLENYFRPLAIQNTQNDISNSEDLDSMIEVFIDAIKIKDENYFSKLEDTISKSEYQEFKDNFSDTHDEVDGYILQPKLSLYFNAIYGKTYFENNKTLLDKLKSKDEFFSQNVKDNKKYKTDFRYKIIIKK